jgi:predicted DNA binding CopG/RHH family protein
MKYFLKQFIRAENLLSYTWEIKIMKNKDQNWRDLNLDVDEVEMLESIERGEWKSVGNIEERRQRLREFFAQESDDMSNININLSKEEYEYLVQKSSQYGISYKELIGKLIQSYTSGKVVL